MSTRLKDCEQLISFHAGRDFNFSDIIEVMRQLFQDAGAQFSMRHFASAEPDCGFNFIALLQPLAGVLHAIAVVMFVGAGTKLNFLDRDDDLLFLSLVCLLFSFILKLSEVDYFADWRVGVGRNLHEVHTLFAR